MGSRPRLHGGRLFAGTTEIGAGMTGGVWVGTGGSRTAPTGRGGAKSVNGNEKGLGMTCGMTRNEGMGPRMREDTEGGCDGDEIP